MCVLNNCLNNCSARFPYFSHENDAFLVIKNTEISTEYDKSVSLNCDTMFFDYLVKYLLNFETLNDPHIGFMKIRIRTIYFLDLIFK